MPSDRETAGGYRLGPHYIPRIECGNCGREHHIDAASGEYQGTCNGCGAFLRRPYDEEEHQFHEFIVWKDAHRRAGR